VDGREGPHAGTSFSTSPNTTEINSVVIDVKEDGMMSYADRHPAGRRGRCANHKMIRRHRREDGGAERAKIFSIARITCFRDRVTARKRPDLAVQRTDGSPWRDRSGPLLAGPVQQGETGITT
jgi:hypothetical protein